MVRSLCVLFLLCGSLSIAQEATPRPGAKKKTGSKATPSESSKKTTPRPAATPKATPSETGGLREKSGTKTAEVKSGKTKTAGVATPAATPKKATASDGAAAQKQPAPELPNTGETTSATPEKVSKTETSPDATKPADAESTTAEIKPTRAPAATLEPNELAEFAAQPPRVQALITAALALTKLNLAYTYGSADPAKGGMDCSGTMYHLLRAQGFPDVPRDSSGQYVWARKAGPFFAVVSTQADGFEFSDLQPGDLLFWTGTYQVTRDVPISHVMLYLGKEKKTGKRVMFGSSDGRSYAGVQRWGVSVFDFKMPRAEGGDKPRVDFVGYGRIPALREAGAKTNPAEVAQITEPTESASEEPDAEKASSTPSPQRKAGARKKK